MGTTRDTKRDSTGVTSDAKLTLRRFAVLFGVGFVGVASLYPVALEQLRTGPLPPGVSLPALAVASLIVPTVLLAVAVVVGLKTAPRLGFRSYLLDRVIHGTPVWPRLRDDLRAAVGWGAIAGVAILLAQFGFGLVVEQLTPQTGTVTVGDVLTTVPFRFLYGGVTEELLLRWGFMSLVAFVLFATVDRGRDAPSARVVWAAILVSAIVFGVGHLPAAAATFALTPGVVAYIIVGNAVGGVVFGWLFWRRSLEAAMLAHASVHVVLVTVSIAALLVT
jgi:membrane protease YdiL (CAAX protease family)